MKATGGGVFAAVDFVGSEKSLAFASGALAKGGKVVVTGLLGGNFATPVAMFPLKAMTIEGTLTGTLEEAQRSDGAGPRRQDCSRRRSRERPLGEAQAALDDLRDGKVVGRVVLAT